MPPGPFNPPPFVVPSPSPPGTTQQDFILTLVIIGASVVGFILLIVLTYIITPERAAGLTVVFNGVLKVLSYVLPFIKGGDDKSNKSNSDKNTTTVVINTASGEATTSSGRKVTGVSQSSTSTSESTDKILARLASQKIVNLSQSDRRRQLEAIKTTLTTDASGGGNKNRVDESGATRISVPNLVYNKLFGKDDKPEPRKIQIIKEPRAPKPVVYNNAGATSIKANETRENTILTNAVQVFNIAFDKMKKRTPSPVQAEIMQRTQDIRREKQYNTFTPRSMPKVVKKNIKFGDLEEAKQPVQPSAKVLAMEKIKTPDNVSFTTRKNVAFKL